jgi:hypothetical protein
VGGELALGDTHAEQAAVAAVQVGGSQFVTYAEMSGATPLVDINQMLR